MKFAAAEPVGFFEPGSPAWHQARSGGISGSEVAAVLGLSAWESPFSLWHRKAGLISPVDENEQMRWGTKLEAVICDEFAARHPGLEVCSCATYRDTARPWRIANPDRLAVVHDTGEMVVVEAKTARDDLGWGEPGTDEIPVHYRCQVLWYLDVLGLQHASVAVLIAGSDYREYEITHDADEAALLRDAAEAFWRSVEAGERPDIDAMDVTYRTIRELHPEIDPITVEVDGSLARDFIATKLRLSAADEDHQLAKSRIADAMGNAQRAEWMGQTIARRQSSNGGTPFVVAARKLPTIEVAA